MIATIIPAIAITDKSDITYPTDRQEREYGDAPENGIAYPSLGVIGGFPTCKCCRPSLWVEHNNFGAWFEPTVDFELEGNAGLCPQCFPPYDQDEGFNDNDAGLIVPEPFTVDNTITVVPFSGYTGTPLGYIGQTAVWGTNVDIWVHNTMPGHEPYLPAYINVLMDWNQNGFWSDVTGNITITNTDDATDFCMIPVTLKTVRSGEINAPILKLLEKLIIHFPMLKWVLNL